MSSVPGLVDHVDSVTVTSPSAVGHDLVRDKLAPAVLAAALGAALLFGAGFASMPALHNAAHDARHSDAFPCH